MNPNAVANQLTINVLAVSLIQLLKSSQHKWLAWINPNTPWVSRIVALATAIMTAGAIHATYVAGTLTITNLTSHAILLGIWTVAQNYIAQHVIYGAAFRK